jgi:hypothetical protein
MELENLENSLLNVTVYKDGRICISTCSSCSCGSSENITIEQLTSIYNTIVSASHFITEIDKDDNKTI